MRVVVNREACEGHAACAIVDEEMFALDDDGYSALPQGGLDVEAAREDTAQAGVDACPLRALRVE